MILTPVLLILLSCHGIKVQILRILDCLFQDMYNCMTGEQHKLLQEKDQLETKLKTKEEEFAFKIEELLSKNKQLENGT